MEESTQDIQEEKVSEKKYVTMNDFQKIELRLGTVTTVSVVEGADKLYILTVDFGEGSPRQVLSGIREFIKEDDLLGKQFPFVTNLAPRMLRGYESQGMILAGSADKLFSLLTPTRKLPNGTLLR